MDTKLTAQNSTVLFHLESKKPINKTGQPASSIDDVKFFEGGYSVERQTEEEKQADLKEAGLVELNVLKASLPDDFDKNTQNPEKFWDYDLTKREIYYGLKAVNLTQKEIEEKVAYKQKLQKTKEAQDYISSLDPNNMTQVQALNAVKAFVILKQD